MVVCQGVRVRFRSHHAACSHAELSQSQYLLLYFYVPYWCGCSPTTISLKKWNNPQARRNKLVVALLLCSN